MSPWGRKERITPLSDFTHLLTSGIVFSSLHAAANGIIALQSNTPLYTCAHLYPFLCRRVFRLLPCLDCCKQCWSPGGMHRSPRAACPGCLPSPQQLPPSSWAAGRPACNPDTTAAALGCSSDSHQLRVYHQTDTELGSGSPVEKLTRDRQEIQEMLYGEPLLQQRGVGSGVGWARTNNRFPCLLSPWLGSRETSLLIWGAGWRGVSRVGPVTGWFCGSPSPQPVVLMQGHAQLLCFAPDSPEVAVGVCLCIFGPEFSSCTCAACILVPCRFFCIL